MLPDRYCKNLNIRLENPQLSKLRDRILQLFEPEIARALIEFGKTLSGIRADYVIFMARKSLCLYDVLQRLGLPPIGTVILSDRVLDADLSIFKGKSIVLIDDAVIIGTTLGKSKRSLQMAGASSVRVFAFCADRDNWCKPLIDLDHVSLIVEESRISRIGVAIVKALSLVPRPYLVDFPVSLPIRLSQPQFEALQQGGAWDCTELTSDLQRDEQVSVLTFFPRADEVLERIKRLDSQLGECIDIAKVRIFARKQNSTYFLTLVPIVTLRGLTSVDLTRLFDVVTAAASGKDGGSKQLQLLAAYPCVQQRMVQYILSAAFGHLFVSTQINEPSAAAGQRGVSLRFDINESVRHYGVWLQNDIARIHKTAPRFFDIRVNQLVLVNPIANSTSDLSWARSLIAKARELPLAVPRADRYASLTLENVVRDLTELFIGLWLLLEKPARNEAHELGAKALSGPTPPHRDRLDNGVPWAAIIGQLSENYGVAISLELAQLSTIVLDLLNDFGIAVPVTCIKDGIVLRAYRYGEQSLTVDHELTLIHDAVRAYMGVSSRTSISHLALEKLSTLVHRFLEAKNIIEPWWGQSGVAKRIKISYFLRGALPIVVSEEPGAPIRDTLLHDYMLERGVIRATDNKVYLLGERFDDDLPDETAIKDVVFIGSLIGILHQKKNDDQVEPLLTDGDLIILTSATTPVVIAEALRAEIGYFKNSYVSKWRDALKRIPQDLNQPANIDQLSKTAQEFTKSKAVEALHSSMFKFVAYKQKKADEIINRCYKYLETKDYLRAILWKENWSTLARDETIAEAVRFDAATDNAMLYLWELAGLGFVIEFLGTAAKHPVGDTDRKRLLTGVRKKLDKFNSSLESVGLRPSDAVTTSREYLLRRYQNGYRDVPLSVFASITKQIERRTDDSFIHTRVIDELVREYGHFKGVHRFPYVLWYDIIDSKVTQSTRPREGTEDQTRLVNAAKRFINEQWRDDRTVARKNQAEAYYYSSNSERNDEKYLFVSGNYAQRALARFLLTLIKLPELFGVHCRIVLSTCDIAGSLPYRRADGPVEGDAFWNNFSLIQSECKQRQQRISPLKSYLLIAGNEVLIDSPDINAIIEWISPQEMELETRVGVNLINVPAKAGSFHKKIDVPDIFE